MTRVKKITRFFTVAAVVIIAATAYYLPGVKTAYTEKEQPVVVALNVYGDIDDLAISSEAKEINEVRGSPIPEASSEIKDQATDDEAPAARERDNKSAGNTQENTQDNTASTPYRESTKEKSGTENVTPDSSKSPASNSPVKRSQAVPYYYNNALSAAEQEIYNIMLEGMNRLTANFPIGQNISEIQINNAFNALIRDQSQIFWVGLTYKVHVTTMEDGNIAYSFEPGYTMSHSAVASEKSKLDKASDKAIATLNDGMSQFEIELAIHDYIIKKVSFNTAAAKNANAYPMAFTAYGALVEGSAVCEGYAKAFQFILNKVGIQTTVVTGNTSGGRHMWSMAKIDGSWYHVDLTFDDGNNGGAILRDYFNLSTSEICRTRSISNNFSFPEANRTRSRP